MLGFVNFQYLKLNAVIAMAGGTCVLAEDKGVETDHALVDGSTCVMWSEVAASQSSQAGHAWVKYVYQLLTKYACIYHFIGSLHLLLKLSFKL